MLKTYVITDDIDEKKIINMLKDYTEVNYIPSPKEEDIIKNCKDADILISLYEPITKKVMDELENLKFISLMSIGFNTIDIEYAKKKNIKVSNNPNYCLNEVADHATALILALNRKLFEYNKKVKENKLWEYDNFTGSIHRLSTQTLGLVGFGSISRKLAKRMQVFGCNVIAQDPFVDKKVAEEMNVELVELDYLLRNSDIISIHTPLLENTKEMFNKEAFEKMDRNPIFINCARGPLVKEEDLYNALVKKQISGAGLDVLYDEKENLNKNKLLELENTIITPHAAFYSIESDLESQELTGKHVEYYIKGQLDKIPLVNK